MVVVLVELMEGGGCAVGQTSLLYLGNGLTVCTICFQHVHLIIPGPIKYAAIKAPKVAVVVSLPPDLKRFFPSLSWERRLFKTLPNKSSDNYRPPKLLFKSVNNSLE